MRNGSVLSLRQHKGWTYASVNGSVPSLRQHKGWTYASVSGCALSLRQHKGWTYAGVNGRMLSLRHLKGPNQGQRRLNLHQQGIVLYQGGYIRNRLFPSPWLCCGPSES